MLTIEHWHPLWRNFKILQDIISKKCISTLRVDNELRYFIIINPLNRYISCHKGNVAFLYSKIMNYIIINTLRPQQIFNTFPQETRSNFFIANWSKFVPTGPIDNRTVLVQITTCCRKKATCHYINYTGFSSPMHIWHEFVLTATVFKLNRSAEMSNYISPGSHRIFFDIPSGEQWICRHLHKLHGNL